MDPGEEGAKNSKEGRGPPRQKEGVHTLVTWITSENDSLVEKKATTARYPRLIKGDPVSWRIKKGRITQGSHKLGCRLAWVEKTERVWCPSVKKKGCGVRDESRKACEDRPSVLGPSMTSLTCRGQPWRKKV